MFKKIILLMICFIFLFLGTDMDSTGTSVMLYVVRGMFVGKAYGNGTDICIPLPSRNQIYVLKVGTETVKIR